MSCSRGSPRVDEDGLPGPPGWPHAVADTPRCAGTASWRRRWSARPARTAGAAPPRLRSRSHLTPPGGDDIGAGGPARVHTGPTPRRRPVTGSGYRATPLLRLLTAANGWQHDVARDARGEPVAVVAVRVGPVWTDSVAIAGENETLAMLDYESGRGPRTRARRHPSLRARRGSPRGSRGRDGAPRRVLIERCSCRPAHRNGRYGDRASRARLRRDTRQARPRHARRVTRRQEARPPATAQTGSQRLPRGVVGGTSSPPFRPAAPSAERGPGGRIRRGEVGRRW
jgi:hypothetical protein